MKDITKDLQQRLNQIGIQRVNLQKQLEALLAQENALKTLLQAELIFWESQQPSLPLTINNERKRADIAQLILRSLANSEKGKKALEQEVRESRIPIDGKLGRVLWGTLLGLSKSGKIEQSDGVWRLKREDTTTVAGRADGLRASSAPTHPA